MSFLSTFVRLEAANHFTVTEVYSRRNLVVLQDVAGQLHLARVDGSLLPLGAVVEGSRPGPGVSVMTCPAEHRAVTMTFLDVGCQLEQARALGSWRDPEDVTVSGHTRIGLYGPNG